MKLTINTRNMSISPAIQQRIERKTETMGRYLWPETEMQIKMTKEEVKKKGFEKIRELITSELTHIKQL